MIFKICGLKTEDTLLCCEKNNVDFFGMIFYEKSPRNITFEVAKNLIELSNKLKINPVGVFVNQKISELKEIIFSLDLKVIQLHGNENQFYIDEIKKKFKIKIIKKISLQEKSDLNLVNSFKNIDYLIFDYKPKKGELPGGNSKTFDWEILQNKKIKTPWFISGGINEFNIKKIKKMINPHGIDLSSGVEESIGIKNNHKINNLFKSFYEN